jgi:hypothetical protein
MPPVGFESTILVSERPKTHALDRTATGIGKLSCYSLPYIVTVEIDSLYTLRTSDQRTAAWFDVRACVIVKQLRKLTEAICLSIDECSKFLLRGEEMGTS